ncbi:MAG: riboflavin biosynthesis protein RibF [Clostridia bacterium]|nr:riboflavin biosynthesis protein RibF [Clostridia bacterium]
MDKKNALALGAFDGFHIGHMSVVGPASAFASRTGGAAFVTRFDVHPKTFFTGVGEKRLMTRADESVFLSDNRLIPFGLRFGDVKNLYPEEFFRSFILEGGFGFVSCGFNFTFAKDRSGDPDVLKRLCEESGTEFFCAPPVFYKNEIVSSTRIRLALENGGAEDANAMLGRPFSFTLPVVHGQKRGRKMGFPTANQILPEELTVPEYGVYSSETLYGERCFRSITDIGIRPTVGGDEIRSETHLIDFDGDLYGKDITVKLLRYMRPERTFESLEELSARIKQDLYDRLALTGF